MLLSKSRKARGRDRHFHRDVLWGQFCLFGALRIRDDILDEGADRGLRGLVEDYRKEARQVFQRHFSRENPFWREFSAFLQTSLRSTIAQDRMERRGDYSKYRARRMYASASSIFKVLVAAYHAPALTSREYRRLCRAADHLVIAAQLIDDAIDIQDDLQAGRFSFGCRLLLRSSNLPSHDEMIPRLAASTLWGNGLHTYSQEFCYHVNRARANLKLLKQSETERYLDTYDRWISHLKGGINRLRVITLRKGIAHLSVPSR